MPHRGGQTPVRHPYQPTLQESPHSVARERKTCPLARCPASSAADKKTRQIFSPAVPLRYPPSLLPARGEISAGVLQRRGLVCGAENREPPPSKVRMKRPNTRR